MADYTKRDSMSCDAGGGMRVRVIKRTKFPKILDRSGDKDAESLATVIGWMQHIGQGEEQGCLMCGQTLPDYAAVGAIIMVLPQANREDVMASALCHRCAGHYDSNIATAILQQLRKLWPDADLSKQT